jgi:hypothetical protein
MELYNLEYRILDKLGRTKKTLWGGLFATQEALAGKQNEVLSKYKKVAFDVYIIEEDPVIKSLHKSLNERDNLQVSN